MYLTTYTYSLGSSMEMCSSSGYYPECQDWNCWLKREKIRWEDLGLCKTLWLSQTSQILSFLCAYLTSRHSCIHLVSMRKKQKTVWQTNSNLLGMVWKRTENWEVGLLTHFVGKVVTHGDNTPAFWHSYSSRKFRTFCESKSAQLSCQMGETCGTERNGWEAFLCELPWA